MISSQHVELDRNMAASALLAPREVVEPLETDDPALPVLDQYDVVTDLLADRLLAGILEPDRERVARPIVIDPYFVQRSRPFLMLWVKYAVITKRS